MSATVLASIPSPSEGEWYLGPVPIRAYALAILVGILVAIWLGEKRWVARGGRSGEVTDIAIWAVLFGVVGARVYHVLTDWGAYFGPGQDALNVFRLWAGGLSIWGGIAAGVLGGYIAARRRGIPFPPLADALAPGILLAQAIGRWGNYFNQELFGQPTDLPWGLEITRPERLPEGAVPGDTFHPTFLYESLWAVLGALVLIWADRRFRMGHGRVFALYVALYTAGRTWVEVLRVDDGGVVAGPAREILGLRINAWVSILLFVAAVVYLVVSARTRPGREEVVRPAEDEEEAAPLDAEEEAEADAAAKAVEDAWAARRSGDSGDTRTEAGTSGSSNEGGGADQRPTDATDSTDARDSTDATDAGAASSGEERSAGKKSGS
ncbi:MAG: prolipoprotein diacylglyceryl transferase [Actinomycetota bacterium]